MAIVATTHVHAGGLAGFVQKHRSIDVYPTGAYRWGLLLLALAASTVATFELNYSSLLPLWMKSLHFTPREFGHYLVIAVVLATISTMLGGGLADRYGRVVVIDLCLTGVIVLLFCNLLMKGFWSFVLVRGGMTVLGGMSYPAVQGLTRDMSPRVGRGAAFGLVLFGAGLSAWVWTFVPGFTLAYFPSWQGQTVIMGIIAAFLYLAVLLWLRDLSPRLRLTIIESEASAQTISERARRTVNIPESAVAGFRILLRRWDIWVLVIGGVLVMTVNLTMQTFGPLIYVQAYKYSPAQASRMVSYYFFTHTIAYFIAGWVSDRLRVRKPFGIAMAAGMCVMLAWWALTFSNPSSPAAMAMFNLVVGALAASALTPFNAFFSEYLEDISPAVTATGVGIMLAFFRVWFALIGVGQPFVAQHFGWAGWIWVVVMTGVVYIVCWLSIRGYWRPALAATAMHAAPEPAAG